jgi:predicted transcriptional regulator
MKLAELHSTGFVKNANIVHSTVYKASSNLRFAASVVPDTLKALF